MRFLFLIRHAQFKGVDTQHEIAAEHNRISVFYDRQGGAKNKPF